MQLAFLILDLAFQLLLDLEPCSFILAFLILDLDFHSYNHTCSTAQERVLVTWPFILLYRLTIHQDPPKIQTFVDSQLAFNNNLFSTKMF